VTSPGRGPTKQKRWERIFLPQLPHHSLQAKLSSAAAEKEMATMDHFSFQDNAVTCCFSLWVTAEPTMSCLAFSSATLF